MEPISPPPMGAAEARMKMKVKKKEKGVTLGTYNKLEPSELLKMVNTYSPAVFTVCPLHLLGLFACHLSVQSVDSSV